jgi:hypothetical protein
MPEAVSPPTPEPTPSLARRLAFAYRQARREGAGDHAAFIAAVASLRKIWPELSAKETSAEVVSTIVYASTHHAAWL